MGSLTSLILAWVGNPSQSVQRSEWKDLIRFLVITQYRFLLVPDRLFSKIHTLNCRDMWFVHVCACAFVFTCV